jgi:hypothetical protein
MAVNYCSMTANYHGILTLEIIGFFTAVIYHKNYRNRFITLGPGITFTTPRSNENHQDGS